MKNIIITGLPRSGKSTLLAKLVLGFDKKVGFITKEILVNQGRVGFEVENHLGQKFTLAHINFETDIQVAKYFVKIESLNEVIPSITKFDSEDLLYLDEIGQMQLHSNKFRDLVVAYLNSENLFISTLSAVYNDDFTDFIRKRSDVSIIEITPENREEKFLDLRNLLKDRND